MEQLDRPKTRMELKRLIAFFDRDKSNTLGYAEFARLMLVEDGLISREDAEATCIRVERKNVRASIANVWKLLGNIADVSWSTRRASARVTDSAVRVVTLFTGDTQVEHFVEKHELAYHGSSASLDFEITSSPFNFTQHRESVRLTQSGFSTNVVWSARVRGGLRVCALAPCTLLSLSLYLCMHASACAISVREVCEVGRSSLCFFLVVEVPFLCQGVDSFSTCVYVTLCTLPYDM